MAHTTRLDRYAGANENFVPVIDPHSGHGARPSTMLGTALSQVEGRPAPRDTANQPGALLGYQGQSLWLVQVSALAVILALPAISEAGPPLICHPFQTGSEAVLPWGDGSSWNTPDARYDVQRLTDDTLRLLSPSQPVIARMENLRRATIYAAGDPRVANELLSAVLVRALATMATATPNADALFDAGYLIESYKQGATLHQSGRFAASTPRRWTLSGEAAGDGYAMVTRAIALAGNNPEMEFAASLMKPGAISEEHRRRAASKAHAGSLLARNLRQ